MTTFGESLKLKLLENGEDFIPVLLTEIETRPLLFSDYDLLVFAEISSTSANQDQPQKPINLRWASLGIKAYETLASRQKEDDFMAYHLLSALYLRSAIVSDYGDMSGTGFEFEILWKLSGITQFDMAEIKSLSSVWKTSSIDVIRRLRKVKNTITMLQHLYKVRPELFPTEFVSWINLREELP